MSGFKLGLGILLAVALGACSEPSTTPLKAPEIVLTPGWSARSSPLGDAEAYWSDEVGKPQYAFLCSRTVPEIVVQAIGGQREPPYTMYLWAAGHRWAMTANPNEDGAFVEGRLPLAEGVKEELLGAGEISIEASNLGGERLILQNSEAFRAVIASCNRPDGAAAADLPLAVAEAAARVTIAADPAPPFTYWAPPGSTIRNHANPGLWVAEVDGKQVATYFGDDCGASRLQDLVGQSVDAVSVDQRGEWRIFEKNAPVTQDLRPNRVNVKFDGATRRVVEVACY